MKIGILTFHYAHNYGAVLQAYALQEYIKSLGHVVQFLDYTPEYLMKQYKVNNYSDWYKKKSVIKFGKYLTAAIILKKRKKAFNNFINDKLYLSEKIVEVDKNMPEFDLYIIGSDQVWNTELTKGFDTLYWGSFNKNTKKISYAASSKIDIDYLPSIEETENYKTSLNNFASISIREKNDSAFFQKFTNKEIKTVLDPTMLVDYEFWQKHSIKSKIKGKYIIVYQVRVDQNTLKIAKKLAKEIGAKVYNILGNGINYNFFKYSKQALTPLELVGLFFNATFIITTSFHGTVFSIIANKPFYSIKLDDGYDNRVHSLLETYGLLDRFISKNFDPKFSDLDFTNTNKIIKTNRHESESYLKDSLKNVFTYVEN